MGANIFLTGVTGYIGGDAFHAIHAKHPEHHYALLVRSEDKAEAVKKLYPNVRTVLGSIDDGALLEKEAAAADIVIHTADSADHEASATAIARGLQQGHSAEKPGFWIHICGTGMLTWFDRHHSRYGQAPLPEQTYGDITDIDRILDFPDDAIHRPVDRIVLASNSPSVRTAIVSPPTIYGPGRGPVNGRSQQIPNMAAAALKRGYAPFISPGLAEWDNVHIEDVSSVVLSLVEATADVSRNSDPEIFGPKAYFFLESGRHNWAGVARLIAAENYKLHLAVNAEPKGVGVDEEGVDKGWGTNSSCKAERARKYLGWKPNRASLEGDIERIVAFEVERLGLKPSS